MPLCARMWQWKCSLFHLLLTNDMICSQFISISFSLFRKYHTIFMYCIPYIMVGLYVVLCCERMSLRALAHAIKCVWYSINVVKICNDNVTIFSRCMLMLLFACLSICLSGWLTDWLFVSVCLYVTEIKLRFFSIEVYKKCLYHCYWCLRLHSRSRHLLSHAMKSTRFYSTKWKFMTWNGICFHLFSCYFTTSCAAWFLAPIDAATSR